MTRLDDYDYELPKDLVAQEPLGCRTDARLMVVDRAADSIEHAYIRDLPDLLHTSDCLVLNDTRVIPARLVGRRTKTGGRWEGLFLAADEASGVWRILAKTRGKVAPGESVTVVDSEGRDAMTLKLLERIEGGAWLVRPDSEEATWELLDRVGRIPLPHYIRGGEMLPADRDRYQTVYAKHRGSVAAPTAGLHFTPDLLAKLAQGGIAETFVTLHVGLDTFRPITVDRLEDHPMHSEWACLDAASVAQIERSRAVGGRVVAVGSTSVRVLEAAAASGRLEPYAGATDLFIHPPYKFRAVDVMLTNFHLPRTTLLVMIRCLGGDALIRRAYDEAIRQQYRFYSYGDAMLIL